MTRACAPKARNITPPKICRRNGPAESVSRLQVHTTEAAATCKSTETCVHCAPERSRPCVLHGSDQASPIMLVHSGRDDCRWRNGIRYAGNARKRALSRGDEPTPATQEGGCTTYRDVVLVDVGRQPAPTQHRRARADRVPKDAANRHANNILSRSKPAVADKARQGGDEAAASPRDSRRCALEFGLDCMHTALIAHALISSGSGSASTKHEPCRGRRHLHLRHHICAGRQGHVRLTQCSTPTYLPTLVCAEPPQEQSCCHLPHPNASTARPPPPPPAHEAARTRWSLFGCGRPTPPGR